MGTSTKNYMTVTYCELTKYFWRPLELPTDKCLLKVLSAFFSEKSKPKIQ